MTDTREDGIYFGLSEDDYHGEPRLSASLMKWLRVSPRDFWVRSFLNPEREEQEDSAARELGKAYHRRILEGSDPFYRDYTAMLDREDYPNAISGSDAIKAALRERELKLGGCKADMIDRLLSDDPSVQVWERLIEDHIGAHPGKTLLGLDILRRVETAAALIEKHPTLGKCVRGGYPEVSVFFTDPETGVKGKSRFDYLKVNMITDLKSFSNPLGKPLDTAVRSAVANYGYYVQAAMYWRALERAIDFARVGNVHGDASPEFLRDLLATDPDKRRFLFLFQDTGPAQVARGYIMPKGTVHAIGDDIVRECMETFAQHAKVFGDAPWIDTAPITEFDDTSFPAWIGT